MRAKVIMPKFLLNKWVLFVLMMLVLVIPFAKAQVEYTTDYSWIDAGLFRDQMAQHSPKVACSTDNPDLCVVLTYFSGDSFGGNHLVAKWTYDGFVSMPSGLYSIFPQTVDYQTSGLIDNVSANYTEMALPYDITYYANNFWITVDSGSTGINYAYIFYPSNQTWTSQWTKPATTSLLNIVEKDYNEPKVFGLIHNDVSAAGSWGLFYLRNGTIYTGFGIGNFDCYITPPNYIDIRGFAEYTGYGLFGVGLVYDVDTRIRCGVVNWHSDTGISPAKSIPAGFTSPYTALWYWDNQRLFYKYLNEIRYTFTSGLVNFGDSVVYHVFDNSIAQYINYTGFDKNNGRLTYAYKATTNQTGRSLPFEYQRGLFVSQRPLKQLRIAFPSATNIDLGIIEGINLTAVLTCNDYTQTDTKVVSSGIVDFYTNCQNNTLSLINTSYRPAIFTFDVELQDTCVPTTVAIDHQYINPYKLRVMVRDSINNVVVSGADVIIDGIANVSGVDGYAMIFNFFPNTNDTFVVSKVGCNYDLEYDGTPRAISVLSSKSSYSTLSKTDYFSTKPFGELFQSLVKDYLIKLQPPSTTLTVKVVSSDGVEVVTGSPNVELSVYGQNRSYLYLNGNYFLQSVSNNLPSTFLLVDNRTSFDVNVTLRYYNEYHQQNVTVFQNGYQMTTIYLSVSSAQLSCSTAEDCPQTSCNNQYFNELIGCIANRCEYSSSTCMSSALCDSSKGCFNLQGTDPCIDDTDCVGLSTCLTNYRSRVGVCGSQGLCIYKDYLCSFQCNVTTGKCGETEFCIVFGQASRRFLIYSTGQYGGGITNTYVDVDFRCGLDHRGERFCIHGAQIPNVGNPKIVTIPDVWRSTNNATTLIYNDISANCDEGCSFNYTYCSYGCNDATGLCYSAPTTAGGSAKNLVNTFSGFFILLFPTVPEQLIIYISISVLIAAGITYLVGKNGSGNNGLVFLGTTIAMSLVGIPIGVVPLFIGVIYAIIAGFLVMKMWRGV